MAWTPPSKFIVIITFLLWIFGIFIILDQFTIILTGPYLPLVYVLGLSSFQFWMMIAIIVFFFSWLLLYLGVKLKGL
ncbi:MAG: hypothetical protein ACFE9Z_10245 [Promethearchaeota archaeon]